MARSRDDFSMARQSKQTLEEQAATDQANYTGRKSAKIPSINDCLDLITP